MIAFCLEISKHEVKNSIERTGDQIEAAEAQVQHLDSPEAWYGCFEDFKKVKSCVFGYGKIDKECFPEDYGGVKTL